MSDVYHGDFRAPRVALRGRRGGERHVGVRSRSAPGENGRDGQRGRLRLRCGDETIAKFARTTETLVQND